MGAFYQTQPAKLRLDIGNSVDIYSVLFPAESTAELRLGADFFTFSRLRSEANFKFPVETTDFLFGINSTFKTTLQNGHGISGRFRLAHISSHLVDGTPNFRQTFVYSREFVDLVGAYTVPISSVGDVRLYAGANMLFHTIPQEFGAITPQIGIDILSGGLGTDAVCLSAGYDAKFPTISGVNSFAQAAQIGLRIGARHGAAVFVGFYWYDGSSMHGMFFRERDSYTGLGFQIDF